MKQTGREEEEKKQTNTLYSLWALSRQASQMLNGTESLAFGCYRGLFLLVTNSLCEYNLSVVKAQRDAWETKFLQGVRGV